ncbi:hypothetical protein COLO4_02861 [Corchorus olitorius]|uniref:Uncharacterized protein n=1 Tax=Corchorus olitorius TaxID=93759 RepID=A0A1R3L065_9ROSI|nr:hypothetical protein COLO4_02861 [Corchorus olitorius]
MAFSRSNHQDEIDNPYSHLIDPPKERKNRQGQQRDRQ